MRRASTASRTCDAGIALLVSLAMAACGSPPVLDTRILDELPVPVAAQEAREGNIRAIVRASGVVVGQDGAEFRIVAPEPARVVEVTRHVGDPVTTGDLLVRFELSSATFDVARQELEVAQAQAQVDSARSSHARVRDLVERGFLPRLDLDAAERALADAELALQRATGAHASAQAMASRAMVFAPFDGLVAERLHDPGDVAQPLSDTPVLRVVDPERLEVMAQVTPSEAPRVLPGAGVRLTSPVQREPIRLAVAAAPQVAQIGPTGLIPVRLSFTTPAALSVDTRVDLEIDAEEHVDVVLVPSEALLMEEDETFLFVIDDEDRVERRTITVGIRDAWQAEITMGLVAGELVITRGQDVLREGLLVTADIEEPAQPSPAR